MKNLDIFGMEISSEIIERTDHVYWAWILSKMSIDELIVLSDPDLTTSEQKIIKNHPISFYKITLQYCFIMEYNKLTEGGGNNQYEHISSLFRLNECYKAYYKDKFDLYNTNVKLLKELRKSNFCVEMRNFRNKKYGHADLHEMNRPFNIKGLSRENIFLGNSDLETMLLIINNCKKMLESSFLNHNPNGNITKNFLRNSAKYKDLYFKNKLMKPASPGL